ncbi:hypothetical protein SMIDD22_00426 [Streptococcus mitis]|uniref:Uncharacterized protein n=1 Tax=Streptococcus mitis TaxID=28037 RepID=A0A139RJA5_STRMT|nr:hypothetical protein SMIDD22_00426 [Streptococcus mitis]
MEPRQSFAKNHKKKGEPLFLMQKPNEIFLGSSNGLKNGIME